jgi:hypothetical protein
MRGVNLHLNANHNAARATYIDLQAEAAVGLGRLRFRVELTAGSQDVVGVPLHLGGLLRLAPPTLDGGYIGQLMTDIAPLHLSPLGSSRPVELTVDVRREQLHAIEEQRVGGLGMRLELAGYWRLTDETVPFWNCCLDVTIEQSRWIPILEQLRYSSIQLIELDMPAVLGEQGRQAIRYFHDAQRRYHEGDWRLTVEALRQSLNVLVGDPPDAETTEQDVAESYKSITSSVRKSKVGYSERYEHARKALKFVADLGSHPEAAEPTKRDARGCLYMVAGLLSGWD